MAVINRAGRPYDEVRAFVTAVEHQLMVDLRPWNLDAVVYLAGSDPPPTTRRLYLWNDATSPQVTSGLGVHDDRGDGHVFVDNARRRGRPWTVLGSHELIEMLVNPDLNAYRLRASADEFWAVEPCDPVEGQTYDVLGVSVANFVYPAYYDEDAPGPYDHLRKITTPYQLATMGYADVVRAVGGRRTLYGVKPETAPVARLTRMKGCVP